MEMRLRNALLDVEVAEPQTAEQLQVFGLRWDLPGDLSYLTMDEAMEAKALEVTEVGEGGSVPELKVLNKGATLVFLMAGEHLVGAKQDRVLNASMMVPANSSLTVDVSCVEAGRWGYQSKSFRSSGSSSYPRLKRKMSRSAYDSYRKEGRPRSDQGEVWDEVHRKLGAMGSKSPSSNLNQAYEDRWAKLNEAVRRLRLPEDCCGAAYVFGGRVVGVDLFDKPSTLAKLLPKLVRAYAIDAMEEPESSTGGMPEASPTTWRTRLSKLFAGSGGAGTAGGEDKSGQPAPVGRDTVVEWLRSAAEMESERFDSPGLGHDVRIQGKHLVGASLLVEDRPVHTELFSEEA